MRRRGTAASGAPALPGCRTGAPRARLAQRPSQADRSRDGQPGGDFARPAAACRRAAVCCLRHAPTFLLHSSSPLVSRVITEGGGSAGYPVTLPIMRNVVQVCPARERAANNAARRRPGLGRRTLPRAEELDADGTDQEETHTEGGY